MKIHRMIQLLACVAALPKVAFAQATYPVTKVIDITTAAPLEAGKDVAFRVTLSGPARIDLRRNWIQDVTLNFGDGTVVPVFTETISFTQNVIFEKTFTHRYSVGGELTMTLAGTEAPPEYTGSVPPAVPFSVTRTVTIAPPRTTPFFYSITKLDVLASAAMEWNPRYFQGGAWMMFLSERDLASRLYFTYKPSDSWAAPLPVEFAEPLPAGAIGAFEISDNGNWLLFRIVRSGVPSFHLAYRANGSTGAFGNLRSLPLESDGVPFAPLRIAENEYRVCRGMGLSNDGLSIFVPRVALYAPTTTAAPEAPFYRFTRAADSVVFSRENRAYEPDQLPRLISTDGRVRIWSKQPTDPAAPDADIFATIVGPAADVSVFASGDRATLEAQSLFAEFRTEVDKLAILHTTTSPGGTQTAPEIEIGAIAPDGSGALVAFAPKYVGYSGNPSTGEFDLYFVSFGTTAP